MKDRLNHDIKIKGSVLCALLLVFSLIAVGCAQTNDDAAADADGQIKVMTSFYPLYDFASKIGGDYVQVENLVATGVEPHDWTPKPLDMAKLNEADIFVYNGWGFEGWVDDFLSGLDDSSQLIVVEAVDGLTPILFDDEEHVDTHEEEHEDAHEEEHEDAHEEEHEDAYEEEHEDAHEEEHEDSGHDHVHNGEYDPHVWLSPLQAIEIASNIKDAFIQADPEHKETYEANYADLRSQLEQLHVDFEEVTSNANRKDIVVSHHAYGYLARDYGLNQLAISGISPDAEPTAQDMKYIYDFIEEYDVQYILFEELTSSKLADTLAEDAGIQTLAFHPIEGLTEEQAEQGEDYISLMRENLTVLEKVLQ